METSKVPAAAQRCSRLIWIDLARGIAVAAMIIYHAAWDADQLELTALGVTTEPAWRLFAQAIAAAFLFLAGVSLWLAHQKSTRWQAFWKRFWLIAGAALLVTLATYLIFPDRFVFFGILHCIAAGSLLGVVLLRAPAFIQLASASLLLLLPLLFPDGLIEHRMLQWIGLMSYAPMTNDYVPMIPWSGFIIGGMACAKIGFAGGTPLPRERPKADRAAALLAWAGRHSLAIYLAHQIILFGAMSGLVMLTGASSSVRQLNFERSCAAACAAQSQSEIFCRSRCACVAKEMTARGRFSGKPESGISQGEAMRSAIDSCQAARP